VSPGPDPAPPAAREGPGAAARAQARAGLYVHVPFCAARCAYCDFASGLYGAAAAGRWLAGIAREASLRAPAAAGLRFSSVYLGGGTPSTLEPGQITHLFASLRGVFTIAPDAEITLEANPESVTPARLEAWREAGVDRLSIGAQSRHADELARLGRIHAAERVEAAVGQARAAGFRRLSLDLIYGFPGHTRRRWDETLAWALALGPEHLSAYAFVAEPGTSLGDEVLAGRAPLPDDGEQAAAYARFLERAAASGLGSYETSNVCRPDAEARHNLVYWLRRPYVGLGPSAHGLLAGERYGDRRDLAGWAEALEHGRLPEAEREPETAASAAREVVMLGLRLTTGLAAADHAPERWAEVERRYGAALAEAVATGRLAGRTGGWAVPAALRFVADEVLAWIEARAEARGFDRPSAHSVPSATCPSPPASGTGAAPTRT
jgi:oxygen-independent coproporphyrinogen III oxidase